MQRLKVTEHHSRLTNSEVVRVDILHPDGVIYSVVVQRLGSQNCVVIDMTCSADPPGVSQRLEKITGIYEPGREVF